MAVLGRVNRVVFYEKEKQVRIREKTVEDSVAYVDSGRYVLPHIPHSSYLISHLRNIAVVLEAKDLSDEIEPKGYKTDPTAPNTKVRYQVLLEDCVVIKLLQMFHKVAKYYGNKKQLELARDWLDRAEECQKSQRRDWSVVVTRARILLESGQYHKALKLAETVLQAKADIGFYFCKYFQTSFAPVINYLQKPSSRQMPFM